jgi:TIR domain-containing protein/PASTA domain-containing protein
MANVFLSYAREDAAKAELIARTLTEQGWTVWWDHTIPPGKTFVIEDALEHASCIVALWSKAAVASHWARAEAAEGMRRGILVPAFLEDVKAPADFGRIEAANLTSWNGEVDEPQFERFLQSVAMLMQSTPRRRSPDRVAAPGPASEPVATPGPSPEPVGATGPSPAAAMPQPVEPSLDSFECEPLLAAPAMPQSPRTAMWTMALAIVGVAMAGGLAWWIMPASLANAPSSEPKHIETAPVTVPQESSVPAPQNDSGRDVPMVVGESLVDAQAQLERIGLVIGAVKEMPGGGAVGTITVQHPAAGERVDLGTPIDLVIAAAVVTKANIVREPQKPKSETKAAHDPEVPALTGLASDVARDRIVRRGFIVGSVSVKSASRSEIDLVLTQDPAPGTRQRPGTAISLVIGGEP